MRQVLKRVVLATALLTVTLIGTAHSQYGATAVGPKKEDASERMDKLFSRWNEDTAGVAIAVVRDGEVIFRKGYGQANLEYDVPVSPSTVFHIASVSKQFTTFAVLLLAAEGKLSLDDEVRKHIPEVPDFGKSITLRHLAHHTSGLRDQWSLLQMAGWRMDDVITRDHIMKLVARQRELNFDPGAEYMYSNTGFTLLAEVVARVSGQSFADFTREKMFAPLGMDDTLFFDDHERIVPNRAYSYRPVGDGYRKSVLSYANVGATSLFTTVEDLARWAVNFEDPQVGNRSIIEQMKIKGVLNDGKTIPYALGQIVGTYRGLTRISHGGGDASFRSYLSRFPDQKCSVILLSNDARINPGTITDQVVDIFLEDELQAPAKSTTEEAEDEEVAQPADSSDVEPTDRTQLVKFTGTYELNPVMNLVVSLEEQLSAQVSGQPKFTLRPLGANRFSVREVGAVVEFIVEGENRASAVEVRQGGQVRTCPRTTPFTMSDEELAEYAGTYHSPELSTEYTFLVSDGKLTISHARHPDLTAEPRRKDLFGSVSPLGRIEFVRDGDAVVGFTASTPRVRNLRFDKRPTP